KERTGGLNEEAIRRIQERVGHLRNLADRKQTILKSIAYQGKLSDPLVHAILAAESPKRLEDLYLPFKPKKRSLASEARGKGKEYEPYASFKEPVKEIPPHRVLAINRGEKEQVLKVRLEVDRERAKEIAVYHLNLADHPHKDFLLPVLDDALDRLVLPSLE